MPIKRHNSRTAMRRKMTGVLVTMILSAAAHADRLIYEDQIGGWLFSYPTELAVSSDEKLASFGRGLQFGMVDLVTGRLLDGIPEGVQSAAFVGSNDNVAFDTGDGWQTDIPDAAAIESLPSKIIQRWDEHGTQVAFFFTGYYFLRHTDWNHLFVGTPEAPKTIELNGRIVAVESRHAPNPPDRDLDIYVFKLSNRSLQKIVDSPFDDFSPIVVGTSLYWTRSALENDIVVVPFNGGRARLIAENGSLPYWSPDGKRIAYTIGDHRVIDSAMLYDVAVVKVDTEARALAPPEMLVATTKTLRPRGRLTADGCYITHIDATVRYHTTSMVGAKFVEMDSDYCAKVRALRKRSM